jgi:hypothetical protein
VDLLESRSSALLLGSDTKVGSERSDTYSTFAGNTRSVDSNGVGSGLWSIEFAVANRRAA